jgi:hypothetical protein
MIASYATSQASRKKPWPSVGRQSISLVLLITMKEVHMILVQLMSRVLVFFLGVKFRQMAIIFSNWRN